MRISDWSSDVCSSDLRRRHDPAHENLRQFETGAGIDVTLRAAAAEDVGPVDDAGEAAGAQLVGAARQEIEEVAVEDVPLEAVALHPRRPEIGGHRLVQLGRSEEHTSELQSLMRHSYTV